MFQIVEPAPLDNLVLISFQNKASDLLSEGRAILTKHDCTDKGIFAKKFDLSIERSKKGQKQTVITVLSLCCLKCVELFTVFNTTRTP
ncbi:hypothetical protein FCU94_11125 [Vibrio sp. JPW-9-11-11]|nr:hypothetical protein [Vibrio sp. JPW-9-11-11]